MPPLAGRTPLRVTDIRPVLDPESGPEENMRRALIQSSFAGVSAIALTAAVTLSVSGAFFPLTTHVVDLRQGAQVFRNRCASCHSLSGEGREGLGPSLAGIGKRATTRVAGQSAEEYLYESIVRPSAFRASLDSGEMPENLSHDMSGSDLVNVTAYLCSQGGVVPYRRLLTLPNRFPRSQGPSATRLELASVERGKRLFFETLDCVKCHAWDESPGSGLRGPSLANAGIHSRAYLQQQIISPSSHVAETFRTWIVHQDGAVLSGRKLPAEDGRVRLLTTDTAGRLCVQDFAASELEPFESGDVVQALPTSPMPPYADRIGVEDVSALVDFLLTLN